MTKKPHYVLTLPGCNKNNSGGRAANAVPGALYTLGAESVFFRGEYWLKPVKGSSDAILHPRYFVPLSPCAKGELKVGDRVMILPGADKPFKMPESLGTHSTAKVGTIETVIDVIKDGMLEGQVQLTCALLAPEFVAKVPETQQKKVPKMKVKKTPNTSKASKKLAWTPALVEEAKNAKLVCFAGMSPECRALLHQLANDQRGRVQKAETSSRNVELTWGTASSAGMPVNKERNFAAVYRLEPGFEPMKKTPITMPVNYIRDHNKSGYDGGLGVMLPGGQAYVNLSWAFQTRDVKVTKRDVRGIPLEVEISQ